MTRRFDVAFQFAGGFAKVSRGGKVNYIGLDGNLISDAWFDRGGDFSCGFAAVSGPDGFNYVGGDGRLLLDGWTRFADAMSCGFGAIEADDGRWNYVRADGGGLLSDRWFAEAVGFSNGIGLVRTEQGKWNMIGPDGRLLLRKDYDFISHDYGDIMLAGFRDADGRQTSCLVTKGGAEIACGWRGTIPENGRATARLDGGRWAVVDLSGRPVCAERYDDATKFLNGYCVVERAGRYNIAGADGSAVSPEWFDHAGLVHDGWSVVRTGRGFNAMDGSGRFMFPDARKDMCDFVGGYARVYGRDGRCRLYGADGRPVSDRSYECAYDIDAGGCFHVSSSRNGRVVWNVLMPDGRLLLDRWYDMVGPTPAEDRPIEVAYDVTKYGAKWNYAVPGGGQLLKSPADMCDTFSCGRGLVIADGGLNYVLADGTFMFQGD